MHWLFITFMVLGVVFSVLGAIGNIESHRWGLLLVNIISIGLVWWAVWLHLRKRGR